MFRKEEGGREGKREKHAQGYVQLVKFGFWKVISFLYRAFAKSKEEETLEFFHLCCLPSPFSSCLPTNPRSFRKVTNIWWPLSLNRILETKVLRRSSSLTHPYLYLSRHRGASHRNCTENSPPPAQMGWRSLDNLWISPTWGKTGFVLDRKRQEKQARGKGQSPPSPLLKPTTINTVI